MVGEVMTGDNSIVLQAARGKAFRVKKGQRVRITNPYGTQAVDTWAFLADDVFEHLSMDNTRSFNSVVAADKDIPLVSTERRPLITIVEDTSAGRHDILLCACNKAIYRQLGVQGYHRSCADNLHEAMQEAGTDIPFTPSPVNLFMSVKVHDDGSIERLLPASKPGAYVTLRADEDILLVLSSCPQDVTTINGPDKTPRDCLVEILTEAGA
jgi:uncharacterized protein YcgI (DUF1989 family)